MKSSTSSRSARKRKPTKSARSGISSSGIASAIFRERKYPISIFWSEQDRLFIAEVPDLPGCLADGKSYREAVANAEVIIREWLETARDLGRSIPSPAYRAALS